MFRIGTTSYIIPADILPNVEYLAPQVDDVELVLFETDEYGSNLPDAALRGRLAELAHAHALTYTVHLPLDLRLGDEGEPGHVSLVKAERVIDATRATWRRSPTRCTWTAGRCWRAGPDGPDARFLAAWQANAIGALEIGAAGWMTRPGCASKTWRPGTPSLCAGSGCGAGEPHGRRGPPLAAAARIRCRGWPPGSTGRG